MNSHLLLEVVDIIVNQQEQIETLKERITKLEQVGEMHE
jgi:cellobiose-specific phosphotransferase enzyme IIA component (PTS system cellobiose-specific EIIA component)